MYHVNLAILRKFLHEPTPLQMRHDSQGGRYMYQAWGGPTHNPGRSIVDVMCVVFVVVVFFFFSLTRCASVEVIHYFLVQTTALSYAIWKKTDRQNLQPRTIIPERPQTSLRDRQQQRPYINPVAQIAKRWFCSHCLS